MSHWNYRLIKHVSWINTCEFTTYAIHEVYYDDDGEPNGWTADPIAARGDTYEEAMRDYGYMAEAFSKPALVPDENDKLIEEKT